MNEPHQSDDFFIPAFLLTLPPQPETKARNIVAESFSKTFHGWADILPLDECVD